MFVKEPQNEATRERIRERIATICEQKSWSQSELARKLGVQRQAVYKWLTLKEQIPNEHNLLELARIAETSVSFLFGETDDPRPARDWHSTDGITSSWMDRARKAEDHLRQALELIEKINVVERFIHPAAVKEA